MLKGGINANVERRYKMFATNIAINGEIDVGLDLTKVPNHVLLAKFREQSTKNASIFSCIPDLRET